MSFFVPLLLFLEDSAKVSEVGRKAWAVTASLYMSILLLLLLEDSAKASSYKRFGSYAESMAIKNNVAIMAPVELAAWAYRQGDIVGTQGLRRS